MDDLIDVLSRVPVFEGVSLDVLRALSKRAHPTMYEKGKLLFICGDEAEYYYIIQKGYVKLCKETLEGEQVVLDVLSAQDVFGHTALFDGDTYVCNAEVCESALIISLPLSELREALYSDSTHTLSIGLLRTMISQNQKRERELEHRSTQSATQRIGCFLLRQSFLRKDGLLVIHLPYDKMLLAARLGMQPETFSRALSRLKKKTGIRVQGAFVYLERIEQLSSYVCPSCSGKFPCEDLEGGMH